MSMWVYSDVCCMCVGSGAQWSCRIGNISSRMDPTLHLRRRLSDDRLVRPMNLRSMSLSRVRSLTALRHLLHHQQHPGPPP